MRFIQGVLALKVKGSVSDNGKRFTFCGNADNSLRLDLGSRVSGKRFSRGIYVLEISRVC